MPLGTGTGKIELKKVTIQAYKDDTYQKEISKLKFVAGLNPESYSYSRANSITTTYAPGSSMAKTLYAHGDNDTLSMTLMFDGTGATGPPTDTGSVREKVKMFRRLMNYQGDIHMPPLLKVTWDDVVFRGFMTRANESHTMFDRDGQPIRVKVETSFIAALGENQVAAANKTSSPDVNRVWHVRERDRMDLIAHASYGDSNFWYQLAKANRVVNPRALSPGRTILLPRLGEKTQ